jgi:hypothetical protein
MNEKRGYERDISPYLALPEAVKIRRDENERHCKSNVHGFKERIAL